MCVCVWKKRLALYTNLHGLSWMSATDFLVCSSQHKTRSKNINLHELKMQNKKEKQKRLTSWRIWSDLRDFWRGSANQSHWEVFYVRLPLRWELEELYASPFGSVDVNCEREQGFDQGFDHETFSPKFTSQRHRMWLFGWANETRHAINALLLFTITIFLFLLPQSHDWKRNETRTWKH